MVLLSQVLGVAVFALDNELLRLLVWLPFEAAVIGFVVTMFGEECGPASLICLLASPLSGYLVDEARYLSSPVVVVDGPEDIPSHPSATVFALRDAALLWGRQGTFVRTSRSKSGSTTTTRYVVVPLVRSARATTDVIGAWALDPGRPPHLEGAIVKSGWLAREASRTAADAARKHQLDTRDPPIIVELCEAPFTAAARAWRIAGVASVIPLLLALALGLRRARAREP